LVLIKSLVIQNLRGIKKCELSDLGQINLLIGKNNAGKSTVLDSLLLASAVMFYPMNQVFAIVNRRSNRSYSPQELLYKYNQHPLLIALNLDDGSNFEITTQQDTNNRDGFSFFLSSSYSKEPHQIMTFGPDNISTGREMRNRQTFSLRNNPNQRKKGVLKQFGTSLRSESIEAPEEVLTFLQDISIVDPGVRSHTSELEEQFDEIKRGEKYDTTFQVLKQTYDDEFRSWELSRYLRAQGENRTAFTYGGGRPVYVDDIGDGMKVGFAAVTLASNKCKTALLVEEIETHQHPSSLRSLVKFLIETAMKNELQLFVSTHSPDVFRYFKMFCPETKVLLVEKNNQDVVYPSDQNGPISTFSKLGWDFGDLFKYERIALVDGIEDCLVVEDSYQKVKGRSLNSDGIELLAVRGTVNFPETVRAFAVSNKKLILIRDLDRNNEDSIVRQTVDWLRVLRGEGWIVEEQAHQTRVGKNDFENRWVLLHSNIITAGNPRRFAQYQTHSMTDYLLEIVLDHQDLFPEVADLPNYQIRTDNSKMELTNLFGAYNNEVTKQILSKANGEIIPASLTEKIINRLSL
jgi:hypothetical protein